MPSESTLFSMASTPRSSSLISLLYLALLTFVGSAVLLAEMHQHTLSSHNVQALLAVLMISSCIWMLWFGWRTAGNKQLKMHQDHHAGASWLKGTGTPCNYFHYDTLMPQCAVILVFFDTGNHQYP